jgi:4-amino-4-deoxy-L-arabinose transferase-like glycosyltransferase
VQDDKLTELPRKAFWMLAGFVLLILTMIIPTALRVGVDPYHEGAIFPSAVGMAQGLHIFSEVNNQYGFIYALIQAPLLYLFGNYLLVARIVGGVVFFLTVIFAYLLIRQVWGRQTSFLVAISCVALNPSWSYFSAQTLNAFGAWINQYGVMLTIISVF